jgi:hypothetical protein
VNAVLVDSDVIVEVLKQRDSQILSEWGDLGRSEAVVVYSPVSAAEIWHGVWEAEQDSIIALFSVMTCAPIDEPIGRKAGEYLRLFHRSHGIELGDALIAATAAIHKLRLWTRNRRRYPMKDLVLF